MVFLLFSGGCLKWKTFNIFSMNIVEKTLSALETISILITSCKQHQIYFWLGEALEEIRTGAACGHVSFAQNPAGLGIHYQTSLVSPRDWPDHCSVADCLRWWTDVDGIFRGVLENSSGEEVKGQCSFSAVKGLNSEEWNKIKWNSDWTVEINQKWKE